MPLTTAMERDAYGFPASTTSSGLAPCCPTVADDDFTVHQRMMEIADIIKKRHGGGEAGPEAARAMKDLVDNGFDLIASPSNSAH